MTNEVMGAQALPAVQPRASILIYNFQNVIDEMNLSIGDLSSKLEILVGAGIHNEPTTSPTKEPTTFIESLEEKLRSLEILKTHLKEMANNLETVI